MDRFARSLGLYALGCAISTVSYALTVRAALGLGPLYAVQDGIALLAGTTLGRAVMIVGVALVVAGIALGQWPRPGTFALPFVTGALLDVVLPHLPVIHGTAWRVLAVIGGTWAMCLGGALLIESALGMSALDGVMIGLHGRGRRTLTQVRLAMEAAMLLGGWALGGAVGVGTVATGLLVGPGLQFWLGVLRRGASPAAATVPQGSEGTVFERTGFEQTGFEGEVWADDDDGGHALAVPGRQLRTGRPRAGARARRGGGAPAR